ncbi:hypothetical protein [Chelativorans sp. AA-79]|uniref:hypothetical protein n=1 Tax=Chelativorans sp. AA-79 TaxID=3028735 RepID=UPI0023F659B9|nr:hypothetical protein [Chelativorans sp. AA-79]WEX11265.1 hypothetical protein PVE73_10175 [Chelativorans sp. AA-79]
MQIAQLLRGSCRIVPECELFAIVAWPALTEARLLKSASGLLSPHPMAAARVSHEADFSLFSSDFCDQTRPGQQQTTAWFDGAVVSSSNFRKTVAEMSSIDGSFSAEPHKRDDT